MGHTVLVQLSWMFCGFLNSKFLVLALSLTLNGKSMMGKGLELNKCLRLMSNIVMGFSWKVGKQKGFGLLRDCCEKA